LGLRGGALGVSRLDVRKPCGDVDSRYELQRWFEGPASGGIWWSVFTDDIRREVCGPPGCTSLGSPFVPQLSPVNRVAAAGVDVARLRVGLFCLTDEGCPAPAHPVPRFNVMAARVRLAEEIPPRFLEPPSGSLLIPVDVLTGEKSVSVPVADGGSGLAQAGLRIDGRDYAVQAVDPDHSTCRPPYPTPVPCPLRHRPTLIFDTATLPNGPHTVRVLLRDAAGNETVSDPYAVVTRNGSQPNGRNAGPLARLRAWLPARGKRLVTRRIGFDSVPRSPAGL